MFACAAPVLAAPLDVAARRVEVDGEQIFEVVASGTVKASQAAVWKVLTDYERMPEFVPDLEKTRLLSRNGNRAILEQAGVARFMFLSRNIHLVVQAHETPMSAIDISLVTGDMKMYDCRWEITPLPDGGTRLDYTGRMVPKFYVPGVLGSNMIRRDITRMMQAVLDHLDKT
ncbi:SRPBCC family protein [Massilia sp. PAMC28688]|nr:SRPBCC family protein [Massilia sp. PAMC28688]